MRLFSYLYVSGLLCFCFLMVRRPPRSTRTDTLFPYTTCCRSATLEAELARIGAAELVSPEDWDGAPVDAARKGRGDFDSIRAEARLKQLFGVEKLAGFGRFGRAALADVGGFCVNRTVESRLGKECV